MLPKKLLNPYYKLYKNPALHPSSLKLKFIHQPSTNPLNEFPEIQHTPEHDLWLATLIQAIYCSVKHKNKQDTNWLNDKRDHIGSFIWICQQCNINHKSLLQKIHSNKKLLPTTSQPQKLLQDFFWFGKKWRNKPNTRVKTGPRKKKGMV